MNSVIPWSHRLDDYIQFHNGHTYNVNLAQSMQSIMDRVKTHGNCISLGSYRVIENEPDWRLIAIDIVQMSNAASHMGVCLGNNVAFLAAGGKAINLYQVPSSIREWDMFKLPFHDVDLGVRVVIDTVWQCNKYHVGYNSHLLENIEHFLCRLWSCEHREYDSCVDESGNPNSHTRRDYDYDKPETWAHGVQCSQLALLTLKRCVKHGALKIKDPKQETEFLSVYSHTCTPAALYHLASRTWPDAKHHAIVYDWNTCFPDFNMKPTHCLLPLEEVQKQQPPPQ